MAATRLYFCGTGTPSITPAFNSLWDSTSSISQRPLQTAAQLAGVTDQLSTQVNETSTTNAFDRLCRQHATDSQVAVAHTISGTFSLVVGALESSVNLNGFLQVSIEVWDSTGTTKRGDLYSGTTNTSESAVSGAINQEFSTSAATVILSGVSVTPVAAQVGDRIVVSIGFRACNTSSTSMGVQFRINDGAAQSDLALTAGTAVTTGTGRPWIEFSDDIFSASVAYTGTASKTVTISATSAANLGVKGSATKAVTVATASAGVRGKVATAAKTITAGSTSAANLGRSAAAAKALALAITSVGVRGKLATAAAALTIAASAAASLGAASSGSQSVTVGTTSAGVVGHPSTAAATLTLSTTASGTVTTHGSGSGSAAKTVTVSTVSAGRLGLHGSTATSISITTTASGSVAGAGDRDITVTGALLPSRLSGSPSAQRLTGSLLDQRLTGSLEV